MVFLSNNMIKVLFTLVSFLVLANTQDIRVENYEISDFRAQSCQTIIDASTFDGDCCSLNTTSANSCVLNVVNGRCVINGQYWTIDWTSTYKTGGVKCPPSEFPFLAPASVATDAPSPGDGGAIPHGSFVVWIVAMVGSLLCMTWEQ